MHVGHRCRRTWGRTGEAPGKALSRATSNPGLSGIWGRIRLLLMRESSFKVRDPECGHGVALWEVWEPTCTSASLLLG